MKTLNEWKEELKENIEKQRGNTYGILEQAVVNNIQWAWENWDEESLKYYYEGEKPEDYPDKFFNDWIDAEPFELEYEFYKDGFTNVEEIKQKAKDCNVDIEIYKSGVTNNVQSLHTDNCELVDLDIDALCDDDIIDWELVDAEDYNTTIYANCGELQEDDVIVVLIKR